MEASVSKTNERSPVLQGRAGGKGGEPIRGAGKRGQRPAEEELVRTTGAIEKRGRRWEPERSKTKRERERRGEKNVKGKKEENSARSYLF
ncbi:hypothetical protein TNCV_1238711 [Trichonephila clavipes]|nr:hypothetical protein TNCV_1238711 [Trichonephila clavipes]